MTQSWGYSKFAKYKDLNLLKSYIDKCNECEINLLINIGPNKSGQLPIEAIKLVKEMFKGY